MSHSDDKTSNPADKSAPLRSELGDGHEDGLEPVRSLDLGAVGSVDDLVRGMAKTSFGGRNLGEAADVLETMVRDPDCFVVMTLAGAMTVAKQGLVIAEMIDRGWIQAVVSTGALMTHGLVESAGMVHFKHDPSMPDEELLKKGYNRVYDTVELEKNLDDTERLLHGILDAVPDGETLCSHKLNRMIGELLSKQDQGRGPLRSAYEKNVPVYVPAFTDSELGLDYATHNHRRLSQGRPRIPFDPFFDLDHFHQRFIAAKRHAIFTIGGGVPRNWAQQVAPYIDILGKRVPELFHKPCRYRYAVRICPEPVEWGGLSGCSYSESVSWGKIIPASEGGRWAEVKADATIAWPLIVRAVMERLDRAA
ncbi:MAG: deoxyhypusine synthase family protein [Candidatus Binatia bacterium]|nr:deoxyhypusine synthase family protein [Candidatus Binatia bacterium]